MATVPTISARDIREVVGQQRLCLGGCAVQTVAQQPGGVGVEEAKRRLHQVFHARLADVARRAEGREVRAHQRGEIDQDPRKGEGKGHPAVAGDAGRLCPVGSHGDEVPGHQPDANVRKHPKDHGYSGQGKTKKCETLITACVAKQGSKVALFFTFHSVPPLCFMVYKCGAISENQKTLSNCPTVESFVIQRE